MSIVKHELRVFDIGGYSLIALCMYVNNTTDAITGVDVANILKNNYAGKTITVSSAISDQYSGYDANQQAINITDGNLKLVRGVSMSGSLQLTGIEIYYNNVCIAGTSFGFGYDGGNPWIEVQPLVCFVNVDTNMLINIGYVIGPTPSWVFGGGSNTLSVVSVDSFYNMLIESTLIPGGAATQGYWLNATTNVDIDDVSREPMTPPTDPYAPGGTSGTGGGGGDFDGSSTPIDFPSLPTVSAVDTGFITLFNPSLSEIQQLADFMWGTLDVDNWRKIFVDPMDAILGLSIVPVAVPDGGQREVCVGIARTNVFMNIAASQYVIVDCGSINVNEYWGAYLDYDPYTKVEIYLPYIGTRPLAADDIMDKTITVRYHVDILSGGCVCFLKCGDSVLYTFVGQCAASIPISGNDWTNVMNGVLEIAAAIGTMVATEGASIPVTLAAGAAAASGMTTAMRPNIERSAAMSGAGGMLGMQTPYLILTRPNQCLPANQNAFTGYPSFITTTLGNCSGYTEVEKVHLEGLQATAEELTEIESFLRGGVIF